MSICEICDFEFGFVSYSDCMKCCDKCICRNCIPKLRLRTCPFCRAVIKEEDIGSKNYLSILRNTQEDILSRKIEDDIKLLKIVVRDNLTDIYGVLLRKQVEVYYRILQVDIGLPLRYVPNKLFVDVDYNSRYLFFLEKPLWSKIIGEISSKIIEDIQDYDDTDYDDTDCDDDPFFEENAYLHKNVEYTIGLKIV